MLYCNELLFFCFAMMNAKRHSKIFLTEAGAGFGGGLLKHGRNEKTICPAGKRQIRIAVDFGKQTVRFPCFLSACGVKKTDMSLWRRNFCYVFLKCRCMEFEPVAEYIACRTVCFGLVNDRDKL